MSGRANIPWISHDYIAHVDNGAMDMSQVAGTIPGIQLVSFCAIIVRKPDHILSNIVVPLYILSIMACMSLLMPPKSGERIGYIITVQLALTFISQTVQEKGPSSGDLPPPKLFNFIRYVTGLCVMSLMETVMYLYNEKPDGSNAMTSIVKLLLSCIQCGQRGNRKIDEIKSRRDSVISVDDIEVRTQINTGTW